VKDALEAVARPDEVVAIAFVVGAAGVAACIHDNELAIGPEIQEAGREVLFTRTGHGRLKDTAGLRVDKRILDAIGPASPVSDAIMPCKARSLPRPVKDHRAEAALLGSREPGTRGLAFEDIADGIVFEPWRNLSVSRDCEESNGYEPDHADASSPAVK
jgi:hypothetical protein